MNKQDIKKYWIYMLPNGNGPGKPKIGMTSQKNPYARIGANVREGKNIDGAYLLECIESDWYEARALEIAWQDHHKCRDGADGNNKEKIQKARLDKMLHPDHKFWKSIDAMKNNPDWKRKNAEMNAKKRKPVIAIEYSTGRRIHYESLTAAGKDLGIRISDVGAVLQKRQKTTHGWRFIYESDSYVHDGIK